MKNVPIVTTNPAASRVMIGIQLLKLVHNNAQPLINILVPEVTKVLKEQLATKNILLANVISVMNGAVVNVLPVTVLITSLLVLIREEVLVKVAEDYILVVVAVLAEYGMVKPAFLRVAKLYIIMINYILI